MAELAAALFPIVDFVQILGNESIAIGHFDFGQCCGVHDVVFLDDVIAVEEKRRQGIDLVNLQRPFLKPRHGPANVIEDGGREWPVAPHRHFWVQGNERVLAADEGGRLRAAFLIFTVAGRAFLSEKDATRLGIPAAGRQFLSIRADSDVAWTSCAVGVRPTFL
jgi:hypothetical protein